MRNQTRRELTVLSSRAMWGILGGAPRRLRRKYGRLYAKEAYRQLKGLPLRYTKGSALVDMIVAEYTKPKNEDSNQGTGDRLDIEPIDPATPEPFGVD